MTTVETTVHILAAALLVATIFVTPGSSRAAESVPPSPCLVAATPGSFVFVGCSLLGSPAPLSAVYWVGCSIDTTDADLASAGTPVDPADARVGDVVVTADHAVGAWLGSDAVLLPTRGLLALSDVRALNVDHYARLAGCPKPSSPSPPQVQVLSVGVGGTR